MLMRHPLTLLTKEVPALDLTLSNVCLLLQDLHAPFTDPEEGWLADRASKKVLSREFDEYFDTLNLVAPNITKLINTARELGLPVVYSCLGYRSPDAPSAFQTATGWLWNLDGSHGRFGADWQPRQDEIVFAKPGWGALANVECEHFLRHGGIRYVIMAGVPFDFGIRQTCLELADRGFGSLVISDAVASITHMGQGYTSGNIAHGLTKLRTTGEMLDLLSLLQTQGSVSV